MSVKQQITETDGIYFITITCYNWLHLYDITNGYQLVYKWFDYLKENRHYIPPAILRMFKIKRNGYPEFATQDI